MDALPQKLAIGFILARSFTLSAFALFVDTIRLASDELDHSGRVTADWQVMSSSRNLITSSCGIGVAPTSPFVDPSRFQYIVVVGGLLNDENPVDRETVDFLKRAAVAKVPLIGVCTGSFVLAAAGLLRYHQTCVSWLHIKEFRERFPDNPVRADCIFNLDRRRGSCVGGTSAADIAATLVRRHISGRAERNALEVLQIDQARPAVHIQPRRPLFRDFTNIHVKVALMTMEQNLDGMTIEDLTASIGVSRRQLERVFIETTGLSPAQAFKQIRMDYAKRMISKTRASNIEVALEVGLKNASHFTRSFKRVHGQTPSQVRGSSGVSDITDAEVRAFAVR